VLFFDAKWCVYCIGAAGGVSEALDILGEEAKELGINIQKFYRYVIDNN